MGGLGGRVITVKEGAADGSLIGGEHGGTRTFSVQQLVVFMLPLGSLRAPLHAPMDGWGKKKKKNRRKKEEKNSTHFTSSQPHTYTHVRIIISK